jgi:hypothetical protein
MLKDVKDNQREILDQLASVQSSTQSDTKPDFSKLPALPLENEQQLTNLNDYLEENDNGEDDNSTLMVKNIFIFIIRIS